MTFWDFVDAHPGLSLLLGVIAAWTVTSACEAIGDALGAALRGRKP